MMATSTSITTTAAAAAASTADAAADVVMQENAATLVDVAAGLAKRAASGSPPTSSSGLLLPTNSASRKLWDREQAAPTTNAAFEATAADPSGHGFSTATSASLSTPTQQQQLHSQYGVMTGDGASWGGPPAHAPSTTTTTPVRGAPQSAAGAATSESSTSMSSIGFGVDPSSTGSSPSPNSSSSSKGDATEAAMCAVRDALERSAVRLPTAAPLRQSISIHIKIGVPPRPSTGEPMHVDVSQLLQLLPRSVNLLPVELVVGGLLVDHHKQSSHGASGQHATICAAVACVTLQQSGPAGDDAPVLNNDSVGHGQAMLAVVDGSPAASPPISWGPARNHLQPDAAGSPLQRHRPSTASSQFSMGSKGSNRSAGAGAASALLATGSNTRLPSSSASSSNLNNEPPSHVHVHRTNSMEMLALVSGEIRERHLNATSGSSTSVGAAAIATGSSQPGMSPASAALAMIFSNEAVSLSQAEAAPNGGSNSVCSNDESGSKDNNANSAYSYKKLAPGMTPKNNKRLFVKHSYKDYSHEDAFPDEQFLVRSQDSSNRTPNAAFPLKLHETLTQIEQDGHGHIIGWLQHGRSFKIHQQQEFVNIVLPKYFVMTKKSSFLRQLNLYGFNRISVGPDGGSYYHEKFLRKLKYLCRRMSRQKVNGNGIRAAGNPDEEPVLSRFPSCPPALGSNSCSSSVSHNENDGDNCDGEGTPYTRPVSATSRPYSQLVPTSASNGEKESTLVTDENASHGSGSSRRQSKSSRVEGSGSLSASGQASFPLKLQRILDQAEATGKKDIISWQEHGKAFLVHSVDRFVSVVVSQYFSQTKYSSFQRQLHMYNFQRITYGRDKGAYHHPDFQRGRPDLCLSMVRTRVNGKGCRRPGDPDNEPDFYEMEHAPKIALGSVVEIPTEGVAGVTVNNDNDSEMQEGSGHES